MAFGARSNSGDQANQHVLLEVNLPDDDNTYKYSVRRLSRSKLVPLQVRAKREKKSDEELAFLMFGEVMQGIESIEGSIDFSELVDKISECGDDTMGDFVQYVLGLAFKPTSDLINDGETIF